MVESPKAASSQAALAHEPFRRSTRTKAGKGGAAEQLEKCADAITHSKRARNDGVQVPSDESVNPMAPRTSPRKRRRHVSKQPKRSSDANRDAATHATKASIGFVAKPTFRAASPTSRFGYRKVNLYGNRQAHSSNPHDSQADFQDHDEHMPDESAVGDDEEYHDDTRHGGDEELSGEEPGGDDEHHEVASKASSGEEDNNRELVLPRTTDDEAGDGDECRRRELVLPRTTDDEADDGDHERRRRGSTEEHADSDDPKSNSEGVESERPAQRRRNRLPPPPVKRTTVEVNRSRRAYGIPVATRHNRSRVENRSRDGERRTRGTQRPDARHEPTDRHRERRAHQAEQQRHGTEYDVLSRHHQRNRAPRPPAQRQLERSRNRRDGTDYEADDDSTEETDFEMLPPRCKQAEKRHFWPGAWKQLIDCAKTEFRVYLATRDAFPDIDHAKQTVIFNIIEQVMNHFKHNRIRLDPGLFPRYEHELYTLIYNDASTFRCEIKKLCFREVVDQYKLKSPSDLRGDEMLKWVRTRSSELIRYAKFLRGPPNEEGIEANFGHKALFHLSVAAFYGSSQKLLGDTEPFSEGIPPAAIVLVASGIKAALRCLEKHGKIPKDTMGHIEQIEYEKIYAMMGEVDQHGVGGPQLQKQLEKWGKRAQQCISKGSSKPIAGDENEFALAPMGS